VKEAAPRTLEEVIGRVRRVFGGGRVADALELLEGADELAGTEEEHLRLRRLRAVVLSRAGRHEDAIAAIAGVSDAWLQRGDVMAAADVYALEAFLHHVLRDLDTALNRGATALVLLNEANDPNAALAVSVHNSLGLVFRDLEANDLAIRQFTIALELVEQSDEMVANILKANLASAHLRKAIGELRSHGDQSVAEEQLGLAESQARFLLSVETSSRRQIEAATILASVLLNSGRAGEAAKVLDDYLADGEQIDDARALVDWNLLLAWSYRERDCLSAAADRAEIALSRSIEANDPVARGLALRERSKIREKSGDLLGALHDLRTADDDARVLRSHRIEVLVEQIARRAQLEAVRRRLQRESEELGRERALLALAAETDPLTGVSNRRRFTSVLNDLRAGPNRQLAALMIDVYRFMSVNDLYGHQTGDRVLSVIAGVMSSLARERDVVCRVGGDEFVVILPDTRLDEAVVVAERVRAGIDAHDWLGEGVDAPVSITVGAAGGWSSDTVELIADADDALLRAKRAGRNRVEAHRG